MFHGWLKYPLLHVQDITVLAKLHILVLISIHLELIACLYVSLNHFNQHHILSHCSLHSILFNQLFIFRFVSPIQMPFQLYEMAEIKIQSVLYNVILFQHPQPCYQQTGWLIYWEATALIKLHTWLFISLSPLNTDAFLNYYFIVSNNSSGLFCQFSGQVLAADLLCIPTSQSRCTENIYRSFSVPKKHVTSSNAEVHAVECFQSRQTRFLTDKTKAEDVLQEHIKHLPSH